MAAFCVVENFDVIEHIATSLFPRGVNFSLDPFPFQKLEKALGHSNAQEALFASDVTDYYGEAACL